MIYGFDTNDQDRATAALLVYSIYRSRDVRRYKVTPDMWSQIERFSKAAAKRARDTADFIERLKPRLMCGTISPRWMEVGMKGDVSILARQNVAGHTEFVQYAAGEQREFLTKVISSCDEALVIRTLYERTAFVVLLVRDRLERERPIEQHHKIREGEIA